jgi:hypothetical protein
MNPQSLADLTSYRVRDIQAQAAQCARPAQRCNLRPEMAGHGAHARPIRSRIGFALVEAGLRLVATASRSQAQS